MHHFCPKLDHKPLEAASLSVPISKSEKNASRNWHNKTFRSVSLWKGSTDKNRRNTMRINKNSTTIDSECDNQDSPHKDNEPKKTYNNNFNNNNNHMDTNDAATRLPKNHI